LIRAVIRLCRLLPAALDRAHLEWARREIDPQHPDVGYILRRIAELKGTKC
jgi:hypothetical protein